MHLHPTCQQKSVLVVANELQSTNIARYTHLLLIIISCRIDYHLSLIADTTFLDIFLLRSALDRQWRREQRNEKRERMITRMLERLGGMCSYRNHFVSRMLSGFVYRRTGVTVPEGRRDEFGLEEITGIFSSPQKALQNATLNESTVEASEDMVGMDSTFIREWNMLRLSSYDAQFLYTCLAQLIGRFLMVYLQAQDRNLQLYFHREEA